jgi:molybdopterin synthase catalytic subunit
MKVTVRLFAVLRDRAGTGSLELELPPGTNVAAARQALAQKLPALGTLLGSAAVAVNQQYAEPNAVLHENDEVALIPPVSGG